MIKIHSQKSLITYNLTQDDTNYTKYSLTMNGESNKEEDVDDNNVSNVCSSSNSTASSASYRSSSLCTEHILRKTQQINRRRAFFHDDVIKNNSNNNISSENENNHLLTQDSIQQISITNNDNDRLSNDENIIINANKPLKRKVVSFSTMPFEKKVADGKLNTKRCFF